MLSLVTDKGRCTKLTVAYLSYNGADRRFTRNMPVIARKERMKVRQNEKVE